MQKLSFTEHPATVGESYVEHLRSASGFAFGMICGGLACLVHGVLPFLFTSTGSSAIRRLHERMILNRSRVYPGTAARSIEPENTELAQLADGFLMNR